METPGQELNHIFESLALFKAELILFGGAMLLILWGFFSKNGSLFSMLTLLILACAGGCSIDKFQALDASHSIFNNMLRIDPFSSYLNLLVDAGGVLTVLLSWMHVNSLRDSNVSANFQRRFVPEYFALILAVVAGAHLLIMSTNLLMVFLSLEMVSIASYILTGFLFDRKGAEGSLKYFLFGSTASALMLYGFSILYGFTGTLDFTTQEFYNGIADHTTPLFLIAGVLAIAGLLYKIAAAPMHPWAPDVYEAAPLPVVAFFSVVPKLAGIGVLTRFMLMLNFSSAASHDWQFVLCVASMLTIIVGNFSALLQKNPKRLMAYSSIAQSGFLMVGIAAFLPQGIEFMLFYATVYLIMNFLVFLYLQYFEQKGFTTIASYQKSGFVYLWPSVFLLMGLISLTGLPPTGGFTAKLFIFSALWESYKFSGKPVLLWLMVVGLLNTVVSLFYYLRIPYFAFIKSGESGFKTNKISDSYQPSDSLSGVFFPGNLLGLILVIALLLIFFMPGLLMGWINKINFVL